MPKVTQLANEKAWIQIPSNLMPQPHSQAHLERQLPAQSTIEIASKDLKIIFTVPISVLLKCGPINDCYPFINSEWLFDHPC